MIITSLRPAHMTATSPCNKSPGQVPSSELVIQHLVAETNFGPCN